MSATHLVAYTSLWSPRESGGDALLQRDLAAIGEVARTRNPATGVTGVLLCDRTTEGPRFVQVLEGPRERVHALLGRIRSDRRHTDLRMLLDVPAPRRAFPDWSMEVRTLPSTADAASLEALRTAYLAAFEPDAEDFVAMVRALLAG